MVVKLAYSQHWVSFVEERARNIPGAETYPGQDTIGCLAEAWRRDLEKG